MNIQNSEQGYHYNVMRRAIDLIDAGGAGMTLDDLAGAMNMSPAHFQRLFSAWVGVSPKRYQQYLTLGHAKALLRERFTTLEVAHEAGLSGGGRLHDLFLRWEAMRPGDYAKGGAGLTIYWGWFESPFGPALVMGTDKGICGIGFSAERSEAHAIWPGLTPDLLSVILVTATQARGTALIHQKMFESRLFFVDKLIDMGAQIILCDPHRATVIGLDRAYPLRGITMTSPDIRAGVSLLIAAMSAEGVSTIHNIDQIDRGYQFIDDRLNALGAKIERVS